MVASPLTAFGRGIYKFEIGQYTVGAHRGITAEWPGGTESS